MGSSHSQAHTASDAYWPAECRQLSKAFGVSHDMSKHTRAHADTLTAPHHHGYATVCFSCFSNPARTDPGRGDWETQGMAPQSCLLDISGQRSWGLGPARAWGPREMRTGMVGPGPPPPHIPIVSHTPPLPHQPKLRKLIQASPGDGGWDWRVCFDDKQKHCASFARAGAARRAADVFIHGHHRAQHCHPHLGKQRPTAQAEQP